MVLDQRTHPVYELKVDVSNTSRLYEYYMLKDDIKKEDYVLDFGCNIGSGLDVLSDFSDNVFGIDVIPELNDILHEKYKQNPKIEYKIVDQGEFGFPNNFFDVIVANNFIEHVNDPVFYLDNLKRLLKPNGYLIITTVNRKHRLYPWQKPHNSHHVTEFSVSSLKKLLVKSFNNFHVYGIIKNPPFFPDYISIASIAKLRNSFYWPFINFLKKFKNLLLFKSLNNDKHNEKSIELSLTKLNINDFQNAFEFITIDKKNSKKWIELVAKCYK